MGILFSQVSNRDLAYQIETPENDSIEIGLIESYDGMSEEFNNIVMEFLQANLTAVKLDNPLSIAMESLSDTASSMKAWFIKWLSRFRKFVRETIERITRIYNAGEKLANKYMKELPNFKTFKFSMYHYTIAPNELEVQEIETFISTIRNGYIRIMRSGEMELRGVLASEMAKISGASTLDEVRGRVAHQSPMSVDEFQYALKNSFRNNRMIPKDIEIDRSKLLTLCREYKALKVMIPAIKKNKETLEKATNEIISFLDKQPNAIREYHKEHSVFNPKYFSKYPNSGISSARLDFEALMKKKTIALSAYFAAANTTLKGIQLVYDQFFTQKMAAVREAMVAYTECMQKAYSSKI